MSDRIKAIRERLERITPETHPYRRISRYDHGGGRIFVDGESGERGLIADLYDEGEREFYWHAPADIRYLLSIAEAAEAYREARTAFAMDRRAVGESRETLERMMAAQSRLFAMLDGKEPTNA